MKKHTHHLIVVPLSFTLTLLFFIYRYMWFTIDTIPTERWAVAGMGTFITWVLYAAARSTWD